MAPSAALPPKFLAGLDENGLGARLGPMLVTGVLARVDERGEKWLSKKLPARLARDLDDSKALVSFKDASLGEAWARALMPSAPTPAALIRGVSLTGERELKKRCPERTQRQCWSVDDEVFESEGAVVERVAGHLGFMASRGVEIVGVRSEILCVRQLNDEKGSGGNRFISDLHAMERLILAFRDLATVPLVAVCGKVGGMSDYERFFGPLSGRLRTTLNQSPAESSYHFPGIGTLRFKRDADASEPLVMLASLVGKYLRELLMARISTFYSSLDERLPKVSGYHDPVTTRLVRLSKPLRRKQRLDEACFERVGAD
jgi:ribonuclease HII